MTKHRRRRKRTEQTLPPEPSAAERYLAFKKRQERKSTLLGRFEGGLNFELDDFQVSACEAVEAGRPVLVAAPTGAGKTIVGEFGIERALSLGKRAFYTTPIKALSNQKFADFCRKWGRDRVGLLTGDTVVNGDADVVVMTTEVLRNMLYQRHRALTGLGVVVLDEVHYLADRFRGPVWEEVILHTPEEVQIISISATVSNAEEFGKWLEEARGDCAVVVSEPRPIPLKQHMLVGDRLYDLYRRGSNRPNSALTDAVARSLERRPRVFPEDNMLTLAKHDLLPAIFFIFSRAGCDRAVSYCLRAKISITTPDQRRRLAQIVEDVEDRIPAEDHAVVGLDKWARALLSGYAAHHAGLLPALKEAVELAFSEGLLGAVFATETLALGINMPARSVVITQLRKWNGSDHVMLTPGQYTQLTGRAGRRGIDVVGHAVVPYQIGAEPAIVASLASKRTYPLISAFRPTYSMAVGLLEHMDLEAAKATMERSFAQFQSDLKARKNALKARSWKEQMDAAEGDLHCSRGDFKEYALARQELSRAQKSAAKALNRARHARTRQVILELDRGDVAQLKIGKRFRAALILSGAKHHGVPTLVALTDDAKIRHISADDVPSGIARVGHMKIPPSLTGRKPRDRKELASRLRHDGRAGKFKARREAEPELQNFDRLKRKIQNHPCNSCPRREEHYSKSRAWVRAKTEYERLLSKVNEQTGALTDRFAGVCAVLREFGYLSESEVTEQGRVLAGIYSEHDLLLAQCLKNDVFAGLSAANLAGAVSACIYETRTEAVTPLTHLPGQLRGALAKIEAQQARIERAEQANSLPPSEWSSAGLAGAIAAWANGASLTTTLDSTDKMPAGDFVRWAKILLDVLGQLRLVADPAIARKAQSAADLIRRGVVAWTEY